MGVKVEAPLPLPDLDTQPLFCQQNQLASRASKSILVPLALALVKQTLKTGTERERAAGTNVTSLSLDAAPASECLGTVTCSFRSGLFPTVGDDLVPKVLI